MALPFRRRIFVILVVMTVVPTVLAVAGWVVSIRRLLPAAGARASTERVAATARSLLEGVDTLHLTVRERTLLRQHLDESFGLRQPRAARRNVPALLHGRFRCGHPAARRRGLVRRRQPRGPPLRASSPARSMSWSAGRS